MCTAAAYSSSMPDLSAIPTPPIFTHEPNDDKVYFVSAAIGSPETASEEKFQLKERQFRCVARAIPTPSYVCNFKKLHFRKTFGCFKKFCSYEWQKLSKKYESRSECAIYDEKADECWRTFDLSTQADRISPVPGEGSFFFGKLRQTDEGEYRCTAKNGNGTAVDKRITFLMTCECITVLSSKF
jgi:hypothetical protein